MASIFDKLKQKFQEDPSTNNALNVIYDDSVFTAPGADELIRSIEMKFAEDFKVQMALGWYYDIKGLKEKSDMAFERALRLAPEDPEARRAVTIAYIKNNNLEGALAILEKMEKSGQIRDYTILNQLAEAYLKDGRDEEALYIFHKISHLFQYTAQNNKLFRKKVLAAEKRLGKQQSILPPPPFNWSWVVTILVIVVICSILLIINYVLKNSNPVYFLNGYSFAVEVSVDGKENFKVYKTSHHLLELPEGEHSVSYKLADEKEKTSKILIPGGIGNRFFKRRDRFFNINLGSVLLFEKVVYSVNPEKNPNPPFKLYAGKEYYTMGKTDYPFQEFPEEVTLPEGSSKTSKSGISLLKGYPIDVFELLIDEGAKVDNTLAYGESQLDFNRNDQLLLTAYVNYCYNNKQEDRCLKFLESRLFNPVAVELHRVYQPLIKGEAAKLLALKNQYDKILKKEPGHSNLLYLRGRIEDDAGKAKKLYQKSIQVNPKNPYPYIALGHVFMMKGDLAKARENYLIALKYNPNKTKLKNLIFELNYGLKKYAQIIIDCQSVLKANPYDYDAFEQLLQVYYAKNDRKKAATLEKKYLRDYGKKYPKGLGETRALVRSTKLYLTRDFKGYLKSAEAYSKKYDERKRVIRYVANVNLFRMKEARNYWGKPEDIRSGYACLVMMLGWEYGPKDRKQTDFWLNQAVKKFKAYGRQGQEIANMLEHKKPLNLDAVDALSPYQVSDKAILCASLASIYPKQKKELLKRAEKLNFNMFYPHFFVDSVIKKMEGSR